MNRRAFLRRFTLGAVSAAALVSLPASLIQSVPRLVEPAQSWALARLQKAFNNYVREHRHVPAGMRVGGEFFTLFEGELQQNQRWASHAHEGLQHMVFKGVPVYIGSLAAPYHYEAVSVIEYAVNASAS